MNFLMNNSQFTVPSQWVGAEVHLLFDSGSEALLWRDGQPLQGLNGGGGLFVDFVARTWRLVACPMQVMIVARSML